jgi:hypothetical protein
MMTRYAVAALLLFTAAAALAQTPTGTLVGRVTVDGKPLPAVSVTATSEILLGERTTTSSASGNYVLPALPPGTYDVEFAREGMITVTRKAIVRVAQTSRVDSEMKATDVAESVTVTERSEPVLHTPAIATTFDAALIDRLPIGRSIAERVLLAPGVFDRRNVVRVDGVRMNDDVVHESIAETTILTGGLSAEYGRFDGGVIATVTKSGSNELHGSIRDDVIDATNRARNLLEATLGGRVVEDRLWLFGAARAASDDHRLQGKASALLTPSQTLVASYVNELSGYYTATLPHDLTVEALASADTRIAKATYVISSHALVAGVDEHAVFVNDRWTAGTRWSFNIGARRDDNINRINPRLGAVYDLGNNQRIAVSYGRYETVDELTASYARELGHEGYVRADAIHRDDYDAAQLHATYCLLGHVTLGGNYTWSTNENRANAWVQFDMPFKDGEINVAVLDHYDEQDNIAGVTVGYAFPIRDVTTFVKTDFTDAKVRVAVGARF